MQLETIPFIPFSLTSVAFGVFILLRGEKRVPCAFFAGFLFATALWLVGELGYYNAQTAEAALQFSRLAYLGPVAMALFFLYFAISFPEGKISLKTWQWVASWILPALATLIIPTRSLLAGVVLQPDGYNQILGPAFPGYALYFSIYTAFAIAILLKKYWERTGRQKLQIRYVLMGATLAFSGGIVTNLIIPLFNNETRTGKIGPYFSVIFFAFVLYAILRHRLMDPELALKKGLAYVITLSAMVGTYFLSVFWFGQILWSLAESYHTLIKAALLMGFLLLFQPVRSLIQTLLDHTLFKKKLRFHEEMASLSREFTRLQPMDRLVSLVFKTLASCFQPGNAFILIRKNGTLSCFTWTRSPRTLKKENIETEHWRTFLQVLSECPIPVGEEDLKHPTNASMDIGSAQILLDKMHQEKLSVCFPLIAKNQVVGFLGMNGKASEEMYTSDEMNLLSVLANQAAIAFENVLFVEKEKELAKIESAYETGAKYIQELERKNKQLGEVQEELIRSERLATIAAMVMTLNHEINNPLAAILANLQILKGKLKSEQALDQVFMLERITRAEEMTKRIADVTQNIQKLSKPELKSYLKDQKMIHIPEPESAPDLVIAPPAQEPHPAR